MKQEEIEVLARDVVQGFKGDEFWIFQDAAAADVAAFARSMINMVLEEVAVEVDKLERRQMRDGSAAMIVREMKVK